MTDQEKNRKVICAAWNRNASLLNAEQLRLQPGQIFGDPVLPQDSDLTQDAFRRLCQEKNLIGIYDSGVVCLTPKPSKAAIPILLLSTN